MRQPALIRRWLGHPRTRALRRVVAAALTAWWKRSSRQAAALTYMMLQSMVPLLMVVVAAAGHLFGRDAAVTAVQANIERGFGTQSATVVRDLIEQAREPIGGLVVSVVALVIAFWGASKVFESLTDSLDEIFCEPPDMTRRRRLAWLRAALRKRAFHFVMVCVTGALLCLLLAASPFVHMVAAAVGWKVSGLVVHAILFAATASVIAGVFWILPTAPKRGRFLWTGAIAATVLFALMRWLFGWYVQRFPPSSAWGAASSLIVLLLWVYWSATMLFLGAELAEAAANYLPQHAGVPAPACSGEGRAACSSPGDS